MFLSVPLGLTTQNGWCLKNCAREIFNLGFSIRNFLCRFPIVSVRYLFLNTCPFLLTSPAFPLMRVVTSSLWRYCFMVSPIFPLLCTVNPILLPRASLLSLYILFTCVLFSFFFRHSSRLSFSYLPFCVSYLLPKFG